MRRALVGLLLLASCAPAPEGGDRGASRAALSAPVKVLTFDAGARNLTRARLFAADGGVLVLDDEPWFVSAQGTATYLGDLQAGWASSLSGPGSARAVTVGNLTYFVASAPTPGVQQTTLWETDGTFDGTRPTFDGGAVQVLEILEQTPLGLVLRVPAQRAGDEALAVFQPGSLPRTFVEPPYTNPTPSNFVTTTGGLVFLSPVTGSSVQLARTDGTAAGTVVLNPSTGILRDVFPPLVPFQGNAWFLAGDGSSTSRYLSITDGTPSGTRVSPLDKNGVTHLGRTAADLVFVAEAPGAGGPAAYFSDGTDAGTRMVIPPAVGTYGTRPRLIATTDTHAFFWANNTSASLDALWGSDGTADGGVVLAQASPAASTATQRFHLATSNRLFFADVAGRPWVSDGTPGGTVQLSSTATGAVNFTALDATRVVFSAQTPATDREPWITDGTPAGTSLIKELYPGPVGSFLSTDVLGAAGRVWFGCVAPGTGFRLCSTDGTAAGTSPLPLPRGKFQFDRAYGLGKANQNLLIVSTPRVLTWDRTNPPQALPVGFSTILPVEDPNGGAWLADQYLGSTARLWFTDGTPAGTVEATPDGGVAGGPSLVFATGATTYLVVVEPSAARALYSWRADAGLQPVVGPETGSLREGTTWGDALAWIALVPDAGSRIVATDDTARGVRVVANPTPGVETDFPTGLVEFEGQLYYALVGSPGTSLERTLPGGGTEQLLGSLTNFTRPRWVRAGKNLYALTGLSISRFDPLTSTFETLAVVPASSVSDVKAVGDGLLVVLRHASTYPVTHSVWATDGTVAGTRRLSGIFEGGNGPLVAYAWARTAADVYLPTWTRETGLEPAALSGAATTPVPLADLCTGPWSSVVPVAPLAIGNTLYVVGDDSENPAIYAVDLDTPSPVGGSGGSGGAGGGTGGGATGGGTGGDGAAGGGDATAPGGCGCTAASSPWALLAIALLARGARRRSAGR